MTYFLSLWKDGWKLRILEKKKKSVIQEEKMIDFRVPKIYM